MFFSIQLLISSLWFKKSTLKKSNTHGYNLKSRELPDYTAQHKP